MTVRLAGTAAGRKPGGFVHLALALAVLSGCASPDAGAPATPPWLASRADQELQLAQQSQVRHDFSFVDRVDASGITFVSRIVDDAGKDYKAVHYDHGTGLCAADVDADGRSDLYFVSQLGTSQLWRNTGGGKFSDITQAAGLTLEDAIGVACSFADTDNDGDPDLFLTTVRHGNHLFENLGGGKFRDISAAAGVGYVGHSSGATFFDYDADGLLDLFVSNVGVYTTDEKGRGGYFVGLRDAFKGHTHADRAEASILYRNIGGNKFQDVSRQTGLVDLSWSGDATPIDVNDDGFLDLYVLDMQGSNHLWLNEQGKKFRDATATYFPKTSWGAMGVKVFDYDGNGRLDLFVTDMHSDMFANIPPGDWSGEAAKADSTKMPADVFPTGKSQFILGNSLFANTDGRYTDVSDRVGAETYWPWGPSVDDLNADGRDDIFVAASMNFPFRYAINSVLLNEPGHFFTPSEFTLGVEPRKPTTQDWFTLDCAGADRANQACSICRQPGADSTVCRGDPNGALTILGARGSRSALLIDLDDDGDLDIVTSEFNARPQVLMSDLAAKKGLNSLKVRLRGSKSNREGLGAQVTVILPDGRKLLKVFDGKSGYLSMSALPLYFGLGDADHATSLEVRWPSGARQAVPGPIAAGVLEVVEP